MHTPQKILVVDDNETNVDILVTRLAAHGYETITASDGIEALEEVRKHQPDLVLLDIMMPRMNGIEACKVMKTDRSLPFTPVIMVTAKADSGDIVEGLEAGADEYLIKPIDQAALVARVKSMLRIKDLHDEVSAQAAKLRIQSEELEEWNKKLEARVAEQVAELERVNKLRRYLSPQVADLVISSGAESITHIHRREISVVFCDLRGFTPFSETAEPEEVMSVLEQYHSALGPLITRYEATLEHFAGDGVAAYFNDPVPVEDPALRAVRMAAEMRECVSELSRTWRKRGYNLNFGVGISHGYATLGEIGFEGRFHYGAIGSVLNLASRLCDEAKGGEILVSQRVYAEVEDEVVAEDAGELTLKGFNRPVPAVRVLGLRR